MNFDKKIKKLDRMEEVDFANQYEVPYPINAAEERLLELNRTGSYEFRKSCSLQNMDETPDDVA